MTQASWGWDVQSSTTLYLASALCAFETPGMTSLADQESYRRRKEPFIYETVVREVGGGSRGKALESGQGKFRCQVKQGYGEARARLSPGVRWSVIVSQSAVLDVVVGPRRGREEDEGQEAKRFDRGPVNKEISATCWFSA